MRGSLSVRINDGYTDRMVTSKTTGLRFRKTAPGGHHSASCTISVPRNTFRDLGPADKLYISDARNARTVWEGYTENPGSTDGPAGQSYDLQASGGMTLMQDMSTPVVFVDRSLDDSLWIRTDNAAGASTEIIEGNAFKMQFLSGQPVATNTRVGLQYQGLIRTGQTLGVVAFGVQAAKVDSGYSVELTTRTAAQKAAGTSTIVFQTPWTTTVPNDSYGAASPASFSVATQSPTITMLRTGAATNVADDTTYQRVYNIVVRANLQQPTGPVATPRNNVCVYADEVVNHMLGATLGGVDGPAARVDQATYPINQLTYLEGATPQKVLDDLALFEPDFLWEVLETGANGKHRFAYRAWPTTPRYEVSTKDGYNAPGGDVDLCNRIVVYWTDLAGAKQSRVVTQTVPELGTRTRDADPLSFPAGQGSIEDALRAAQTVLATKAAPPTAATVTVRRPIMDNLRGCMVMPWEIEPGYLVRVRETGDDLRLTEMEYTDSDCSATLTLGTPTLSVEQILAKFTVQA